MYEQDYIMRLIREMVRMLLKLLFHMDLSTPAAELLKEAESRETLDILLDLVDNGDINEAENRVYELISDGSMQSLQVALFFYACLNDKTDDFLEENGFSRREIKEDLEEIVTRYGLSGLSGVFLGDA